MKITTNKDGNDILVTVDLGKSRQRGEYTVYKLEDMQDVLAEKVDLEGYVLVTGPRAIAKHRGPSSGTYVFTKEGTTTKATTTTKTTTTTKDTTTASFIKSNADNLGAKNTTNKTTGKKSRSPKKNTKIN